MNSSVLYFPTIRPPENDWFTRVLLYWDTVGVILPGELADDDVFLRPYTGALLKEGLLVPVSPTPSFWWSEAADHVAAFVDLVDQDRTQAGAAPTERKWVRVHLTKISYGLVDALCRRGLAKEPAPCHSFWVDVEARTANLLMAYLAVIVGKDETVAMDPITDSESALDAFTVLPENGRPIDSDLQPIRYALLRDVLPGPAAGIEPGRLAEFKTEHSELLTRFRTRVERNVSDCAQIGDDRLRSKEIDTARAELKDEVDEIERRMSERRWPMALRGALGVVIAALGIADLAVIGGSPFAALSGTLGLAGSVNQALQGRRRPDVFERPLAFAAFANREFGQRANA